MCFIELVDYNENMIRKRLPRRLLVPAVQRKPLLLKLLLLQKLLHQLQKLLLLRKLKLNNSTILFIEAVPICLELFISV